MKKRKNRKNGKSITLTQVCQQLKQAVESKDSLAGIVDSLKILSMLSVCKMTNCIDALKRQNNRGEDDEILKKLKTIQSCLVQAGFKKHGINQTRPGQKVTEYTVFLGGNGYDLTMQSVHFWRQINGNNAYEIVSRQAQNFINSNISPVIKTIEDMGANAKSIAVAI